MNVHKSCSVEGCGVKSRSKGMCQSHYNKARHLELMTNRGDEVRAKQRKYYKENKHVFINARSKLIEWQSEYGKARYQANKEKIKAHVKEWGEKNKKKLSATKAAYYKKNAARISDYGKKYRLKNKERVKLVKSIRRKATRDAQGTHDYTQLRELLNKQRWLCVVCKASLKKNRHKDHIVPLVSGGSNYIENIQFLCATCNMQKNKKDPIEFMQQKGFLL